MPSLHEAVKNKCDVDHIRAIRGGSMMWWGAADLCEISCVSATRNLASAIIDCTESELDDFLNITNSFEHVQSALEEQAQCNPPSTACFQIFRDLRYYEQSPAGQTCYTMMEDAKNTPVGGYAQAKSKVYCHSECGLRAARYIHEMEKAGCTSWGAYREAKLRYDLSCTTAQGLYCASEFSLVDAKSTIAETLSIQLELRGWTVGRERLLQQMCTPCFYEYLRIQNRYTNTDTATLKVLEKLCVTDQGTYCFPRYLVRTVNTSSSTSNVRARELCDIEYMGRCTQKLQVRELIRLQQTNPSSAAVAELQNEVDTLCLQEPTEAQLCADVMTSVIGGYDYTSKTFSGPYYTGPAECSGVSNASDCSWACQKAFTVDKDLFGCCYLAMRRFFEENSFEDVDSVFSRADVLGEECNRLPPAECPQLTPSTATSSQLLVEVPLWYLENNLLRSQTLTMYDIMRATGLSSSAITVTGFRYNSDTTTWIDFTIVGTTKAFVVEIISELQEKQSSGRIVNFDTEHAYNMECHGPAGARCNTL